MQDAQSQILKALSVEEVKQELEKDAILLDTRQPETFTIGFIPGSVNIAQDAPLADWATLLLPLHQQLILLTDTDAEQQIADLLANAGFDHISGFVAGGFAAWQSAGEPIDLIIEVEADELAMDIPFDDKLLVLDVRQPAEFAEGHVKDAVNIPLNELADTMNIASLEEDQNIYIHSNTGYRSVVAASLLKRQGVHNIRNITGGWNSIQAEKRIEVEKDNSQLN